MSIEERIKEKYKQQIIQQIQNITDKKFKSNPNHYPIIDKWNYKYVYKPNKFDIFDICMDAIENYLEELTEEADKDYIECFFNFDKPYTKTMWGKYNYLNGVYDDKDKE